MTEEFPDFLDKPEVLMARLQAVVPRLRLDEAVKKLANDRKAVDLVHAFTIPDLRPGVEAIFDLIDTATPIAAAVLRTKTLVAIFREMENDALPLDVPSAVLMAMGPPGPHQDALRHFVARPRNNSYTDEFASLALHIVRTHCVEALPLLRGCLTALPHQPTLYSPIHVLSKPFQIRSEIGPTPAARMRQTLEFMQGEGLDLSAFGLVHRAADLDHGCVDALVVLLGLGLDPDVEDIGGRKALPRITDPQQRDQWKIVVHSFKARRSAHQLLEEIDLDAAPAPV